MSAARTIPAREQATRLLATRKSGADVYARDRESAAFGRGDDARAAYWQAVGEWLARLRDDEAEARAKAKP